ncbi:MAG: transglycosylase SLT domain-containing protein [Muribaculaceae bacterium]|nr:transglycosylase SLT domain-containing protein [Muribaculaceae bacterium]
MEQRPCPSCGKQVLDGIRVCPYCGHSIPAVVKSKSFLSGMTARKVIFAVLAFLAITQMILIIMMMPKSCARNQDNVTEQIETGEHEADAGSGTIGKNNGKYSEVIAPEIPKQLEFCGEKMDFDRVDMAERLDRELTNTIYNYSNTSLIIKRANRYFPLLEKLLKANNIPVDMLYLAVAESSLGVNSVSPAGAVGLWQFMPSTGKEYGLEINDEVDERYDIEKETVAACKFLRKAYSEYHNWATVCTSFNAGMGGISKNLAEQLEENSLDLKLNSETSRYVFRIIAYKIFLQDPKKYGYRITSDQLYNPIEYDIVEVSSDVPSWASWAKSHGINYMQLRDANPWIRSTKLTNSLGNVYKVKIPKKESLYISKTNKKVYNKNWVVD